MTNSLIAHLQKTIARTEARLAELKATLEAAEKVAAATQPKLVK